MYSLYATKYNKGLFPVLLQFTLFYKKFLDDIFIYNIIKHTLKIIGSIN